jgi:type III secretion system YscQ/HrcQ family protein
MMQAFDWAILPELSADGARVVSGLRHRLPAEFFSGLLPPPPGCSTTPWVTEYRKDWSLAADSAVSFVLRSDSFHLSVRYAGALALASVDDMLGAAADKARPARALTEIEAGIFEYCLIDWLDAARGAIDTLEAPLVDDLASPAKDIELGGPVVCLQGTGEAVAGRIEVRLHQLPNPREKRHVLNTSPLFALPIELAVRAGTARLTPAELESLSAGDIIILEEAALTVDDDTLAGSTLLASTTGATRAHLKICPNGDFEITSIEPLETPMTDANAPEPEDRASEEAAAGLSDLLAADVELTLAAELGRLRVSLAHTAGYGVGTVLQLGKPVGSAVDLTLSGRLIGRAELLNVDGELGVRITEWSV